MNKRFTQHPWTSNGLFYSNPGSPVEDEYILDFPECGGVALKKVGERPIYEMIQANLSNCELKNVIESCVHSNQVVSSSIDSVNELFSDFTGFTNLAELYSSTKRVENTWNDLPIEVRENFDSDIKKFIKSYGSDDFHSNLEDGFDRYYTSIAGNTISDIHNQVLNNIVGTGNNNPLNAGDPTSGGEE